MLIVYIAENILILCFPFSLVVLRHILRQLPDDDHETGEQVSSISNHRRTAQGFKFDFAKRRIESLSSLTMCSYHHFECHVKQELENFSPPFWFFWF